MTKKNYLPAFENIDRNDIISMISSHAPIEPAPVGIGRRNRFTSLNLLTWISEMDVKKAMRKDSGKDTPN